VKPRSYAIITRIHEISGLERVSANPSSKFLRRLDLRHTDITELPTAMAGLSTLRELDIRNSAVSHIPEEFSGMNLWRVQAEGCNLVQPPCWIRRLSGNRERRQECCLSTHNDGNQRVDIRGIMQPRSFLCIVKSLKTIAAGKILSITTDQSDVRDILNFVLATHHTLLGEPQEAEEGTFILRILVHQNKMHIP